MQVECMTSSARIQQVFMSAPAITPGRTVTSPNKIGPYLLRERIGEGGFANIRVAINERGHPFACKIVPKRYNDEVTTMIEREIAILAKLDSPLVVRLYDVLQDSLNYYLIMELCLGGTLYDLIQKRGKLDEFSAKTIFLGICEAVRYIHRQGVAHRDIKPENIIVDDVSHVKLIDFGLSEMCDGLTTTTSGSCSYQSPEMLRGEAFDPFKADVWSVGVVLFAMVIGYLPWTRRTRGEVTQQIRDCQFFVPMTVSPACRDAILGMMNPDCEARWTIDQVLQCEWLRDVQPLTRRASAGPLPACQPRRFPRAAWHGEDAADVRTMLRQANRRIPVVPKSVLANRRSSASITKKPIVEQPSFSWSTV